MQKVLTPKLLEILIQQDYRYCLSKTTRVLGQDANTCIILTPIKYKPALSSLSAEYDAYFEIEKEPGQMANGIPDTLVLLDLDEVEVNSQKSIPIMNKRILILDDDADILSVMHEFFIYENFEPFITDNTDIFISLAHKIDPALIIIDYSLNGTNGGVLCTQIKSTPALSHIPVIIFTAYTNKGIKKGSFGCDDFITKPFNMDDLITRIKLLTTDKIELEA